LFILHKIIFLIYLNKKMFCKYLVPPLPLIPYLFHLPRRPSSQKYKHNPLTRSYIPAVSTDTRILVFLGHEVYYFTFYEPECTAERFTYISTN
jgi:hypothetical protein